MGDHSVVTPPLQQSSSPSGQIMGVDGWCSKLQPDAIPRIIDGASQQRKPRANFKYINKVDMREVQRLGRNWVPAVG